MISIIVCMGKNRVIGKDNQLIWKLPEDLRYFREKTLNKTILMGRKTYESIGKALPKRNNLVLTRDKKYRLKDATVIRCLEEFLKNKPKEELFIIGGANVYEQSLPYADRLYITQIEKEFEGDSYFPEWDVRQWDLVSKKKGIQNEENPYEYDFYIYERKNRK